MLGLKLIHVSKRGHLSYLTKTQIMMAEELSTQYNYLITLTWFDIGLTSSAILFFWINSKTTGSFAAANPCPMRVALSSTASITFAFTSNPIQSGISLLIQLHFGLWIYWSKIHFWLWVNKLCDIYVRSDQCYYNMVMIICYTILYIFVCLCTFGLDGRILPVLY